ncbi:MAG: hypothetical protein GX088_01755 [Clostridia bacterium]|nr:hypothetical protein [Clostridia bacterium]
MLCDECGKRPARVHITKIVNDKRTKLDLCEECAQKHKTQHFGFSFEPTFSIHSFLAGLLEDEFGTGVTVPMAETGLVCDMCGMSFAEFSRNGRMGCGQCYETFREKLKPLLKRIHGHYAHTGKIPKQLGENIRYKRELESLRRELETLVAEERFEEAAVVRDRIRELERRVQG